MRTLSPYENLNRRTECVALILVLLFVVLLTAMVVSFTYETQVEASFVENTVDQMQAHLAAKSAIYDGMSLLAADIYGDPDGADTVAEDELQDIVTLGDLINYVEGKAKSGSA